MTTRPLRVALVVGTLGQGGAEKQCVFLLDALQHHGAEIRLFVLSRGGFYEPAVRAMGVEPIWIGRWSLPPLRLLGLARRLRSFRPDIVQAWHFYANLYAVMGARLASALDIGSIRNDVYKELGDTGRWGRRLLRAPSGIIANSHAARNNAAKQGIDPARIQVLPNVIDLEDFDRRSEKASDLPQLVGRPAAVAVANARPAKRLDRFLLALQIARQKVHNMTGVIIGDGPDRTALEHQASELGLTPGGAIFLGRRDDVPALLRSFDMLVLSSQHEGFPNVLLEAMAAGLPVVTTPAGDAARIVEDRESGFVVDFDDVQAMADRIVKLATSADLRRRFGQAGRNRVERVYSHLGLPRRVVDAYRSIASLAGRHELDEALRQIRD